MNHGYYSDACLLDLVVWSQPLHGRTNWLFVVLDSNRNLSDSEDYLSSRMREHDVTFWWGSGGLWLPGGQLGNSYVRANILVPFTACYILYDHVRACPKPEFLKTTDLGCEFTDSEVDEAAGEVAKLQALGYTADGCGLQYVVSDEELASLIARAAR